MSYKLELTDDEYRALAWMTDRGYFPETTFDEMSKSESEPGVYEISEHAAWDIQLHREQDPHSLFACAAPELLEKLLKLEGEIV